MTSVANSFDSSLVCEPHSNAISNRKTARVATKIQSRVWCLSLFAIGVWSACVAALISVYIHPAPRVHDEFSYMLAADTLLHGRLANPTPPAWEALQSIHTIMQPHYASKYPVGAGLLVAMGMFFGMPLASSWLGVALMTVCITWMIAGVMPKRWALLGGAMISLSPFIQLAWSQSLLNGFLPASGCALLIGGVLRLRRRVAFSNAFISGCGIGLLAISRPFEGLCCTAICATMLWFAWSRHSLFVRSKLAGQVALFAAAPIAVPLILIAAHNHAVTGDWRQMPYQLHESQFAVAPVFVFESPKLENTATRTDLPQVIHDFHAVDSLNWYRERIGIQGWLRGINDAFRETFKLTFPFCGLLLINAFAWRNYRLTRWLIVAVAMQIAASACVCWVYTHYLAPTLPWVLLLSLLSLRVSLKDHSQLQIQIVRMAILAVLLIEGASLIVFAGIAKNNEAELWSTQRQAIVEHLSAEYGKHLILVRYTAEHNVHQEWVYNLAEPGEGKILWARFEDGRWVNSLLHGYPNRKVWIIDPDDQTPILKDFTEVR